MKPLVEIQTIPIAIEYKVNNAKLQRADADAVVELSRKKSGYRIKSRPIKISVDSFETRRNKMPRIATSETAARSVGDLAWSKGTAAPATVQSSAYYSASARRLTSGQVQLDMQLTDGIPADSGAQVQVEWQLPAANAATTQQIQNEADVFPFPQNFSIKYEMNKASFEFMNRDTEMEFVPGSIEITIKQYPGVKIEYIGGPLYVPPSADPNYEPVDTRA
jgi:hypothetical protein